MTKTTINNNWKFIREDVGAKGFDASKAETITIPHTWNGLDGQNGGNDYYRGRCWYRRNIDVAAAADERVWVEFQAVNSVAEVFVNGTSVGVHEGGYSTFRFDITDALAGASTAELLVSADNSHRDEIYPLMADFTFMGGIYRDVSILSAGTDRFDLDDHGSDAVYVTPSEVSKEKAVLGIRVLTVTADNGAVIRCRLLDSDGQIVTSAEAPAEGEVGTELTVEKPRLWSGVADPYLYTLEVELLREGNVVDSRCIPVGIRGVHIDAVEGFFLNGEHVRLKGMSRHQDRKDIGWALLPEHQDQDMDILLDMGANSVRLAHYQHNRYFYDLCDRRGVVAWAEIPFISVISDTDESGANAKSQMIELVKQNCNHPSIAFWGVQNEITIGGPDETIEGLVRMLAKTTKSLDSSRITVQAQVGHHPDKDSMHHTTDAIGYNKYFGWYYGTCEDFDSWLTGFAEAEPDVPLGITEYGCEGILTWHSEKPKRSDYTEEYQALYHEKVLNIFNRHPRIWGTYNWNLFDFASDLRDEGGVRGMNNKGLVTHDRSTFKDSYYWYKVNWSDEPMLHITAKRFVNRVGAVDIKVYSNTCPLSLNLNGQDIDGAEDLYADENPGKAWIFRGVELAVGENLIIVSSGDGSLSDEAVFVKVDQPDESYRCPESQGLMDFVANWFDSDGDDNDTPLDFPEGYFSVRDKIGKILNVPEGEVVLRQHAAQMFDHPMFGMMKTFTFEKLQKMVPDVLTDAYLRKLNQALNQVKKPKGRK